MGIRTLQVQAVELDPQLKRYWSGSSELDAQAGTFQKRFTESISDLTHFEVVQMGDAPDAVLKVRFGLSEASVSIVPRDGKPLRLTQFKVPAKSWACRPRSQSAQPIEKSKKCLRRIGQLIDKAMEGLLAGVPYKGFVIESGEADGVQRARINLGEVHGVQYGQLLELIQVSAAMGSQAVQTIGLVRVTELSGSDQALVTWFKPTRRPIPLGAKVSYRDVPFAFGASGAAMPSGASSTNAVAPAAGDPTDSANGAAQNNTAEETEGSVPGNPSASGSESDGPIVQSAVKRLSNSAQDANAVIGKYWFLIGFEQLTYGAIAVAPQYVPQVFRFNSAPAGRLGFGNNKWSFQSTFTSVRSAFETVGFADLSYLTQIWGQTFSQKGWVLSAGARSLILQVTDNGGAEQTGLKSQTLLSPLLEIKYRFVPRDRLLITSAAEAFWPVYNSSVDAFGMIFSFGAGASVSAQLALTERMALDLSARLRYLRRLVDRQSASQERQSSLGLSLVFAF